MPDVQAFLHALDGHAPPHEGWPTEALALLSVARMGMEIADAPGREEAMALWPEFEVAAGSGGSRRLLTLFSTWKAEILEGTDHAFVDAIAATVETVRRRMASRRPALGLGDLRAFVLLLGFERGMDAPGAGMGRPGRAVSRGTPLSGLALALSG